MKNISEKLLAMLEVFDLRDAFVFGGTGLVGFGVGQIYAPAASIFIGSVMLWLGLRKAAK